jgi:hypothetical protein
MNYRFRRDLNNPDSNVAKSAEFIRSLAAMQPITLRRMLRRVAGYGTWLLDDVRGLGLFFVMLPLLLQGLLAVLWVLGVGARVIVGLARLTGG